MLIAVNESTLIYCVSVCVYINTYIYIYDHIYISVCACRFMSLDLKVLKKVSGSYIT